MTTTDNIDLQLIEDSDYLKTAIKVKQNANLQALDTAIQANADAIEAIPDSMTADEALMLAMDSVTTVVTYMNGSSVSAYQVAEAGDVFEVEGYYNTDEDCQGDWYAKGDPIPLDSPELTVWKFNGGNLGYTSDDGTTQYMSPSHDRRQRALSFEECGFVAPSGSEFSCWNTMSDGSGDVVIPGDVVDVPSGTRYLYAVYDKVIVEYYQPWVTGIDRWGAEIVSDYELCLTKAVAHDETSLSGVFSTIPVPLGYDNQSNCLARKENGTAVPCWNSSDPDDLAELGCSLKPLKLYRDIYANHSITIIRDWDQDTSGQFASSKMKQFLSLSNSSTDPRLYDGWETSDGLPIYIYMSLKQACRGQYPPNNTLSIVRTWTWKESEVSYKLPDGTVLETKTLSWGDASASDPIERPFYIFGGWYKTYSSNEYLYEIEQGKSLGDKYEENDSRWPYASTWDLYGKYTGVPVTIHFDLNAPDGTTPTAQADRGGTYGSTVTLGKGSGATGWVFTGYSLEADGEQFINGLGRSVQLLASQWPDASSHIVESDGVYTLTLYDMWHEAFSYQIAFDANGGTGSYGPLDAVWGTSCSFAAASAEFTRTGYTFAKWAYEQDGSGTTVGTAISRPPDEYIVNGVLTLYAVWTEANNE